MSEQDNKTEEVSSTNINLDKLLECLDIKELKAMELKLDGIKYKDIACMIETSEQTIKNWFMKEGKLYFPYQKYKEWKIKKIRDSAVEYGKLNVKKAMKALVDIMEDTEAGAGRVSAAKEILDRVLGRVPNVNVNFDNAEYDEAAEIFKDVINKMK